VPGHGRQRKDLRNRVWVHCPHSSLQVAQSPNPGLDKQEQFALFLNAPFPGEDRAKPRDDVHARGEALLHEFGRDSLPDVTGRHRDEHNNNVLGLHDSALPHHEPFETPRDQAGQGSVIYYKVADIQGAFEMLSARGVAFEGKPHLIARMPDHELWMTFFRDPDHNVHALMSEVT